LPVLVLAVCGALLPYDAGGGGLSCPGEIREPMFGGRLRAVRPV